MTTSIDAILSELNFSKTEKRLFSECLELIRKEQLDGNNSTASIIEKVKEADTDED